MGRYLKDRELKSNSYAIRMPVGTSALQPPASLSVVGQIRYNTDTNKIEYYNGSWQSVAKEGVVSIVKDSNDGLPLNGGATLQASDSSRVQFTMSQSYASGSESQVLIFVGGVFQNPKQAYTFNGTTTITFSTAPPAGQAVVILHNLPGTVTV